MAINLFELLKGAIDFEKEEVKEKAIEQKTLMIADNDFTGVTNRKQINLFFAEMLELMEKHKVEAIRPSKSSICTFISSANDTLIFVGHEVEFKK